MRSRVIVINRVAGVHDMRICVVHHAVNPRVLGLSNAELVGPNYRYFYFLSPTYVKPQGADMALVRRSQGARMFHEFHPPFQADRPNSE
jgi:hypothetical protein